VHRGRSVLLPLHIADDADSGSNMAINSKRRRRTLNHGFETRTPPGRSLQKGAREGGRPN
jgi:hypothetical protein